MYKASANLLIQSQAAVAVTSCQRAFFIVDLPNSLLSTSSILTGCSQIYVSWTNEPSHAIRHRSHLHQFRELSVCIFHCRSAVQPLEHILYSYRLFADPDLSRAIMNLHLPSATRFCERVESSLSTMGIGHRALAAAAEKSSVAESVLSLICITVCCWVPLSKRF